MHGICAIDRSWELAANTIKSPKMSNANNKKFPARLPEIRLTIQN